jgi:hypothetical protein
MEGERRVGVRIGIRGMRTRILLILFRLGECKFSYGDLDLSLTPSLSARDVKGLWNDPAVKEYLTRNRYKLEHLPGLYVFTTLQFWGC